MLWLILVVLVGIIGVVMYRESKQPVFTPMPTSPTGIVRQYRWPLMFASCAGGLVSEYMRPGRTWAGMAALSAGIVLSLLGILTKPPRSLPVKAAMWIVLVVAVSLFVYAVVLDARRPRRTGDAGVNRQALLEQAARRDWVAGALAGELSRHRA